MIENSSPGPSSQLVYRPLVQERQQAGFQAERRVSREARCNSGDWRLQLMLIVSCGGADPAFAPRELRLGRRDSTRPHRAPSMVRVMSRPG